MRKNSGFIKMIVLLIVLPLLMWEFSLKKSYLLYWENKQIEEATREINATRLHSSKPAISATSPLLSNGKLLDMIALPLKEYPVEIVNYQPSLINEENVYKLYAGELTLQGNFISLVKTINFFEQEKLPIKLSSANFSYKPSKEIEGSSVELTLTFQQIEN